MTLARHIRYDCLGKLGGFSLAAAGPTDQPVCPTWSPSAWSQGNHVLLFPILYEMGDAYPFRAIHEKIRAEVEGLDATLIDLFPRLKAQRDDSIWVHHADQHPNEKVERTAAEELAAALWARGRWR
jgi:hypothetical protein